MSALLKMNVSPRTALAIIVVAALVSLVAAGREAPAPAPVAQTERAAARAADESPPDLELDKLERPGLGEPLANLFATPRPAPAARAARSAPVAPAAPAVPVAPPVPFRYLGKFVDGGQTAVYVARGDQHFLAAPGATLGPEYRVEEVAPAAITLVYLPLGTRQTLPIPPQP